VVNSLKIIPIYGNLTPASLPRGHEIPELIWVTGTASKLTAHADDGNRLAGPLAVVGLHCIEMIWTWLRFYARVMMKVKGNKDEYIKK
jgi:hypothetical protein